MSSREPDPKKSLQDEFWLFAGLAVFFTIVDAAYMAVAKFEVIGSTVFTLLAAMSAMSAGYLWVLARRTPVRPEDRPSGNIAEGAGEVGVFSSASWWPLICGAGAALAFLAVAIGWWIMVPAVIISVIGLVGMVFEFSTGRHAH